MAIAVVQTQTRNSHALGTSGSDYISTFQITPAGNVTSGNTLVLVINTSGSGGIVSTVTDASSNSWSKWFSVSLGDNVVEVWTTTAGATATPVITMTNAVFVSWGVILREYSGLSASPRDVYGTNLDTAYVQSHGASTSTAATTGDLVLGGFTSSNATDTYSVGSGFGDLASISGAAFCSAVVQDKVIGSGGVQSSTITSTGYDKGISWVAAFKPSVTTTPDPPTGLLGAPLDTGATITWSPSAGATTYSVKRSTTSGSGYSTAGSPSSPTYADSGLTNGTTYYYVVTATNSFGTSANSAEVSVTPIVPDSPSWYAYGTQPTGKTLAQCISSFMARYNIAKAWMLTQTGMPAGMPAGAWRVAVNDAGSAGGQPVGTTFSEGIGYWMILCAYTSRIGSPIYDPQAKAIFDGLWLYYKHYKNDKGLMNWRIDPNGNVTGTNGATDGDEDVALGLVIMARLYSSAGAINYAQEATTLINAIDAYEFFPASDATYPNLMKNGDGWDPNLDNYMPDYAAYAHWKEFGYHTGNTTRWNDIVSINQARATTYFYTNYPTGYVPNASTRAGANLNNGDYPYKYGYNAIRHPWRNTLHFLWDNDSASGAMVTKLANAERARANQIPANARANGDLGGLTFDAYINAAYMSGFAVAGVANSATAQWAADGLDWLDAHNEQNYFGYSLELMARLIMTGEMKPYRGYAGPGGGGVGGTPDPSAVTATVKYYNGTAWVPLSGITIQTVATTVTAVPTLSYAGNKILEDNFETGQGQLSNFSILNNGRMTADSGGSIPGAWMAQDVDVSGGALRLKVIKNATATAQWWNPATASLVNVRREGGYISWWVGGLGVRKGGVWRWKQQVPGASLGWGFVPLLWPVDEVWPAHGEINFPELFSGSSTKVGGQAYTHYADITGAAIQQQTPLSGDFGVDWTLPHICAIAWNPGSDDAGSGAYIKYYVDDVQVGSVTDVAYIPHGNAQPGMNLRLQTEAYGTSESSCVTGPLYWRIPWVQFWSLP